MKRVVPHARGCNDWNECEGRNLHEESGTTDSVESNYNSCNLILEGLHEHLATEYKVAAQTIINDVTPTRAGMQERCEKS